MRKAETENVVQRMKCLLMVVANSFDTIVENSLAGQS